MGLDVNAEPDTDWLRYSYTSLTTPATTYELNVHTGERRLTEAAAGAVGYDPANYVTERLWATAATAPRCRCRCVYRKGFEKNGKAALLQYAYGSYGPSTDPGFNVTTVSLLDRGVVYAIAHIRGGQEMGRDWYDDGKLLNKKNTFTDFIDVTDYLVQGRLCRARPRGGYGGSAGGLLMGAIANMAPDKYRVIVSQVPFVDVVTTMLDASIPLTTNEYDEWGNPEEKKYYDYMLTYSPYDNRRRHRPIRRCFVGTGLWDSQVQYWEPAKYVARLRDLNTVERPGACSAPTWKPATAASPAASSATANRPRCIRSCSTGWVSKPASDAVGVGSPVLRMSRRTGRGWRSCSGMSHADRPRGSGGCWPTRASGSASSASCCRDCPRCRSCCSPRSPPRAAPGACMRGCWRIAGSAR